MAFAIQNLRLQELAAIAAKNLPFFNDLLRFLNSQGYSSLHAFVREPNDRKAAKVLIMYFNRSLPEGCVLYDGTARPYHHDKAKWLLWGWIFRDAPEQRLKPMLGKGDRTKSTERKATLLNEIRKHVGAIFPEPARWEWPTISEVMIDRLEGSRRAIKGTLFEAIVRSHLRNLFKQCKLKLEVPNAEKKIKGETYDVQVKGRHGTILLPVKTRETMGGGHAHLFTRDIFKSISVAKKAGYDCIPIVIAESWGGDLTGLSCKACVYIDKNPNQIIEVEPLLATEIGKLKKFFVALT